MSIDRMRELNDQLNHELGEVKNQIELIALEADTTIKVQKVENSNYKDLKALFTSMKNDVTRTRQENSKLREEMNNLKQEHKEPVSEVRMMLLLFRVVVNQSMRNLKNQKKPEGEF